MNFPAIPGAIALRGQRIGLLGGSFNPAHAGHVHISQAALRRLRLDAVWWLVSPQNPLKSAADMAPLARRLSTAKALTAAHRGIRVTALLGSFAFADIGQVFDGQDMVGIEFQYFCETRLRFFHPVETRQLHSEAVMHCATVFRFRPVILPE